MRGNHDRRLAALETGNGTINVGDLLDAIGDPSLSLLDPRTWPKAWAGKALDPAMLRALDALDPGFTRYTTEEVKLVVRGDETRLG
jgi:hypothetical protein